MASSLARLKRKTKISILVCGRTGVGKSALINFILGKGVCEVSHQGNDREGIHEVVHESTVTICESSDGSVGNAGALYMKYQQVDLIIYCQRMTDVRLDFPPPETDTFLRALTGGGFLGKTVLVLTKANLVEPFEAAKDGVEYFQGVYLAMTTMINSEVAKASREEGPLVTPPTAVPVGSARYPTTLPNGKHFMGNLCVSCLERLPQETERKIFIQATNFAERLIKSYRSPSPRESLGEHIRTMSLSDGKDPPYPIYMDEEDSERLHSLGIEVCKFRYAGCKKVLPHKEMEGHMKSFKDSTAHIEILAKQLQSMYQQNVELKEKIDI